MNHDDQRYEPKDYGIVAFCEQYSHLYDHKIDTAVVAVAEAALRKMTKIIGGDFPSNLQGLLGCWSWVLPRSSQLCFLLEHAQDKKGYYVGHEIAHLLHYDIYPDLFDKDDLRTTNLKEMIAHAGGLLFEPYAKKVQKAVRKLEKIYFKKNLHFDSLLKPYSFSPAEDYDLARTHDGGYKAAEFILSKGVDIRRFVELDADEAEKKLAKWGYPRGLYIEPEL